MVRAGAAAIAAPRPSSRRRRPKNRYAWAHERRTGTVEAYTTAEARAQIKAALGIGKKGRVPAGCELRIVGIAQPEPIEEAPP